MSEQPVCIQLAAYCNNTAGCPITYSTDQNKTSTTVTVNPGQTWYTTLPGVMSSQFYLSNPAASTLAFRANAQCPSFSSLETYISLTSKNGN